MHQTAALARNPHSDAFLGVERSLTGRAWLPRLGDDRQAYAIAQTHGIPELLARILAGRGVALAEVPRFLAPSLRDSLPDPSALAGMDAAAERLSAAVIAGESICIFGDYDVDGATSSALLERFLRAIGANVRIYIPDRIVEGYGPNVPALQRLAEAGVRLVITVDCGTQSFVPLEAARRIGLDVIVVDHHQANAALPAAVAIVNPNRLDCGSGQGMLAAVGLAFLLAVATARSLRRANYFNTERVEPNLLHLLDLVALGTVADVVPLTGLNRTFVAQGLKIMARGANTGLRALGLSAALDRPPTPYHLGFVFGPRVNAGGRVGEAGLGARLLTTEDWSEAQALAAILDRHNRERQAIEAAVLDEAREVVEGSCDPRAPVPLVVAGEGWHPGVIGIVASRLKEIYQRPVIVIGLDGALGKGSGRSIAGVDLGGAVRAAMDAGLLVTGGGHAMAAGLSLNAAGVPAFAEFLNEKLGAATARAIANPCLLVDGVLGAEAAQEGALLETIARGAPYGAGNPEPVFALPAARVVYADGVGESHIALNVEAGSVRLRAIAFRAANTPLGEALLAARGNVIHLAGRIKEARRGGAELVVEDAALPS